MVLSVAHLQKEVKQQHGYVIRVFSGSWKEGAKEELEQQLIMTNPFDYDTHKQEIEERFETNILPDLEELRPSTKGEGLEFSVDRVPEPFEREAIREFFKKQFKSVVSISINKKLD